MELSNLAWCSIYNDHSAEKQTNMKHNKHNIIMTWDPYRLLELYNIAHGNIDIHIHMYINQNHQTYIETYTKAFTKTTPKTTIQNFLHKKLSPWHFAICVSPLPLILSSFASLKPQFLISCLENKRKPSKVSKTLVPHFLFALPAVPCLMVMSPAHLTTLSLYYGYGPL